VAVAVAVAFAWYARDHQHTVHEKQPSLVGESAGKYWVHIRGSFSYSSKVRLENGEKMVFTRTPIVCLHSER
jgi:hypothetical protein